MRFFIENPYHGAHIAWSYVIITSSLPKIPRMYSIQFKIQEVALLLVYYTDAYC